MGKILPIILALLGLGAGIGGGIMLRPAPEDMAMDNPCGDPIDHGDAKSADAETDETVVHDYVKLNNQFVIPVVESDRIAALVVISLTLEVEFGQSEAIYQLEPKLRDEFLQVLFDHANSGGFAGDFTSSNRMHSLRNALLETAKRILGNVVSDVLITDVVRQDA